jgi:hypothetical protein
MQKLLLVVALDGNQPLWLGCWLLVKAKAGKSPTKGTLRKLDECHSQALVYAAAVVISDDESTMDNEIVKAKSERLRKNVD